MSDEHWIPETPTADDDQALGTAVGAAIRERVETPASRPPVARIAELAAARARARNTRRAVAGIAASIALVAGGIAAWNALEDDQPTEIIVVDESAITPEPVPTAAPIDAPSDAPPKAPADSTGPATPEGLSTGPVLEWLEFNPATVFGSDLLYVSSLESVGDGRAMVQAVNSDSHQVMVSANGVDWTAVAMPPDLDPEHIDITGERWLVTGWPTIRMAESIGQALFSDDQGATWTDLSIPLDPAVGNETSSVAAALVAGENMVVAVISRTHPDVASVIVARGLVPDKESIQGWISVEGDTVSFTRDESSAPVSFEMTPEEEDLIYGGTQRHVRLYFSDGGPAELAAEYPGWAAKGYGADDGFHLILINEEGEWLLTSPEGRQWRQSPLVDGDGVPVGQSYSYSGSHQQTIWTAGQTGGDYRIERSEDVYAPPLVAEYPNGIRGVDRLAVGPAGIAVVAEAGSLPGLDSIPEMRLAKDGYELRYYEPVGGFTLWDLTADAAVYAFDPSTATGDALPEGVRQVEGDDGSELLVFYDPDTGAELVAFTEEERESLVLELGNHLGTDAGAPSEQWVGWSADGNDWGWQTLSDAFSLFELTEEERAHITVEVAVGAEFVMALVLTYDVEVSAGAGDDDDNATELTPHAARWYIATVR